mgnify:CR=1 FL=1|jgi:hypothetical protein
MANYERGICPECKVKEGNSIEKTLYQCKSCERWFCTKHFEPRLAFIKDLKSPPKYPEIRAALDKEMERKDGHPCFTYSRKRFEELVEEEKLRSKRIEEALDRSKASAQKKGCFIATAAYGTPMARELRILRRFRDNKLKTNNLGIQIVTFYYRISPPIAVRIANSERLRALTRYCLKPVIQILTRS